MRKRHIAAIAGAASAFVVAAGVTRHEVQPSAPAPCVKPTTFLAPNDTDPIVLASNEFGRAVIMGQVEGHPKFQDQALASVELVAAPVQTPTKVIVQVLIGSDADAIQYWALTFVRSCNGQDYKLVKAQEMGSKAPVQLPPIAQ